MKTDLIFVKNILRGIDPTWVAVPSSNKLNLWEDGNHKNFPNFTLLEEAKEHVTNNGNTIGTVTKVSYSIDESNEMSVMVNGHVDGTYSDVVNDKQALELLEENYGV